MSYPLSPMSQSDTQSYFLLHKRKMSLACEDHYWNIQLVSYATVMLGFRGGFAES